jgi:hypothetical protein
MYLKTIFHTLPDGTKAKFTIRNRTIDGEPYYYANAINVELDFYKKLSENQKETTLGIEITDGNQNPINYKDPERLISDILTKYGKEWLKSEK